MEEFMFMNVPIPIENLDDEIAIKVIYSNNKQNFEYEIRNPYKIDFDNAISKLHAIGTSQALIWAYKLEVIKIVGWNNYSKGPIECLNYIRDNIQLIKARGNNIFLAYKNVFYIAFFENIPTCIKSITEKLPNGLNIIKNKEKIFEVIDEDEAIKAWLEDKTILHLRYFFNPIVKIKQGERAIDIDLWAYEKIQNAKIFDGDNVQEMIEKSIINNLIPKINNENTKIRLKINGLNSNIKSFCKFKNLIKRKSLQTFLTLLEKYDIPRAVAETDLEFDDIEFQFDSYFIPHEIAASVAEEGQKYLKYYLNDLKNQLNNNQFYGFKFSKNGKLIEIEDVRYIEENDDWRKGLEFLKK
jgi:hypothetical protein